MEILNYITANMAEFTALGAALLAAGGIIVKLTPTEKDNEWWSALMKAIGRAKNAD